MYRRIDGSSTSLGVAVTLGLALVLPVVRADVSTPSTTALWALIDPLVGIAFCVSALVAVGDRTQRALVAAVGPAWLLGTLLAPALTLHQGVLVVALVAFPGGRPRGTARIALCALGVGVAAQLFTPLGTAAVLAVVGVVCAVLDRPRGAAWYPSAAASAVAVALLMTSVAAQSGLTTAPVGYAASLVVAALAFPVATRHLARARRRLDELAIGTRRRSGLEGLEPVLADLLDDPALRLRPVATPAAGERDDPARGDRATSGLVVQVGDGDAIAVESGSPALTDESTRRGVVRVVQLIAAQERLQALEERRVVELAEARLRLLEAADRERVRMAQRLRSEALEPLDRAAALLAPLGSSADGHLRALLDQVRSSTEVAELQMHNVASGVPPVELGDGRLRRVLEEMGLRLGSRVAISVDAGVVAPERIESTAFYVCSEAIANALKHSGSPAVRASVSAVGSTLRVEVLDRGTGRTRPDGPGLQGLADRVAAVGGRFDVRHVEYGGTQVIAELPL